MKHYSFSFKCITLVIFCGFLSLASATKPTSRNDSDRFSLVDFKSRIVEDPLKVLSSWNDSVHFCSWVGITCKPAINRVVILNLEALQLTGSLSPSLGNLSFLTTISLGNNYFHGEIPPELGNLVNLQHLNLSFNNLGGKIPSNISHCTQLTHLVLYYNGLVGVIPDQLSSLSKMVFIGFDRNNLTGRIPIWIGNFSSLRTISLAMNNFQGNIPNEFGHLTKLEFFQLFGNNLSGIVPSAIYNVSSISYFTFTQNRLSGTLPSNVGLTLPNLQVFAGGVNNFVGSIPISLANASRLQVLDFAGNGLTGKVPENLGSLRNLVRLNFEDNKLGNGQVGDLNFVSFLANCTKLNVLSFAGNFLGGELPPSIANISKQLTSLTLGRNLLHGSIPTGIGNFVGLNLLGVEGNDLGGRVPVLGNLHNLAGLYLNDNRFSGPIPSSLGNLSRLTVLFMEGNRFEGRIPSSLGNCKSLLALDLSGNNLNGTLPKEILGLSSLSVYMSVARNFLTGSLPSEVGYLVNLAELDLSDNKLSGKIPSKLGSCISLERLRLRGNEFEGTIPLSLETLRGLEELDLSQNNLSGQIPAFLGKFTSLKKLNLSYNKFEGEVPKEGIFSNANSSAVSVLGNYKLCGGIEDLHLPTCRKLASPKVSIPLISTLAVLVILLLCILAIIGFRIKKSRQKRLNSSSSKDCQSLVSFSELSESTGGFSVDNLIGSGSFGSVYRGILAGNGEIVAIKVLNLQQQGALKSFTDECKALRSIRHRNLLKIITSCSSVDQQGNEFKALVFEFMSNGNLDQWLHQTRNEQCHRKSLNFIQRLNIAIDVACALDYLHNHCETPIVHCDLKPSNVLLDEDMVAHVGDFGLAQFILEESDKPSNSQTLTVSLKGSIGYIPPEYGAGGKISILGDIYSYGILFLEMFTGKRPTDDMFKDGLNIHSYAAMGLPQGAQCMMDMNIDPSLMYEEQHEDDENKCLNEDMIEETAIMREVNVRLPERRMMEECLVSVLKIGLSCSSNVPKERMLMNDVVNKMLAIRDSFLKFNYKM